MAKATPKKKAPRVKAAEKPRTKSQVFADIAEQTLRAKVTVVGKRDSNSKPDLGLLRHQTEIFNQDDDLVLSYAIPSLVYRREPKA